MAEEGYIATIQVLIQNKDIKSEVQCSDFLSEFFDDAIRTGKGIKDWQYLRIGGYLLSPQEKIVRSSYREGEAFE